MRFASCVLLILWVVAVGAAGQPEIDPAGTVWEVGTYWTYETSRTYTTTIEGSLTVIVLDGEVYQGIETWLLAIVSQWYDENDIVSLALHNGPSFSATRWPVIVDHIPQAKTRSSETGLTRTLAATPWLCLGEGLPIRVQRALPVMIRDQGNEGPLPEWIVQARETGWTWESITLTSGEAAELALPGGSFPNAIPVSYAWDAFGVRHTGEAWWSAKDGWWIQAEGQEEESGGATLRYTVTLANHGVFSEDALKTRLLSALVSTERVDPIAAELVRTYLETMGLLDAGN